MSLPDSGLCCPYIAQSALNFDCFKYARKAANFGRYLIIELTNTTVFHTLLADVFYE